MVSKIKIDYYSDVGFEETAIEKIAQTMISIEAFLVALIIVFIGGAFALYGYISGGLAIEFAILFMIIIACLAFTSAIIALFLFAIDDHHTGKVNKHIAQIAMEILSKRDLVEGKRIC